MENISWKNDEVQTLICLWSEDRIQADLASMVRNDKIFQKIASRLGEMGIIRSAKQCREKIKKLKQDYKKIKDHNNKSGVERKTNRWYDMIDAVLGHRPANAGRSGSRDSATALLRAIADEEDSITLGDGADDTSEGKFANNMKYNVTVNV